MVPIQRAGACTADLLTAARNLRNFQITATVAVKVLASVGTAGCLFRSSQAQGRSFGEEGLHCKVIPILRAGACTADLLTAVRALPNSQTAVTAAAGVLASMGTAGGFLAAPRRRVRASSEEGWHCMVISIHRAGACTADLLTAARALQNSQTAATAAVEVLASIRFIGGFFRSSQAQGRSSQ
jgi:hypothetical protein